MKTMMATVAVAALVSVGSAGCSSDPPSFHSKRGVLPPGTAHITIDGADAGTTGVVECAPVGTSTTIRAGDSRAGVTVGLSTGAKFSVEFVRIHNLNGFTGDYNLGLGGDAAAVSLTDATYHVTGGAFGYTPTSIAPTTQLFAITAAC